MTDRPIEVSVTVDPHPDLDPAIFVTRFPVPLSELPPAAAWADWLRGDTPTPIPACDDVRSAVRDLLRHGGYKPTGRGKPASEYLVRAAEPDGLRSINAAVDACNIVSLHSGLPISVVDLDRCTIPLRVGIAEPGAEYVFNPSGQTMQLGGLLCLHDAEGPCANAVKDSQRTKTSEGTRETVTVIWGTRRLPGRTESAKAWYFQLLGSLGCHVETIWTDPA